ncbi:Os09g0493200 [Oryza sativa Japonica Group]|uniref:Os09g0493200 protein n=1 Tax=Oryza sativa subsp. japonica TaxID=39947 RepID=A0A0P0XQ35_ORYSJ|nr:hypothetical protein EE612_048694 [Oryza sativa]BAT08763.1 Os09g0493200 [Oryza sativa Japonica Group]
MNSVLATSSCWCIFFALGGLQVDLKMLQWRGQNEQLALDAEGHMDAWLSLPWISSLVRTAPEPTAKTDDGIGIQELSSGLFERLLTAHQHYTQPGNIFVRMVRKIHI